jgi:large subunit ribosomal protein L31
MKKEIHPKEYRMVAFKDMSNGHTFLTRSTVDTKETVEISSTSHPFYTGKVKLVDTAGRVDKFMNRYGKHMEKRKK